MADTSIRDKVVTQILTDLEGITVSNGYHHTVRHVEELKDVIPSSPTTPAIYLVEGVERANESGAPIGFVIKTLNLGVTFIIRDATDPGKTARKMLEDVIKAIQPNFRVNDSQSNSVGVEMSENSNMYIFEKRTSLIHLGVEIAAEYTHKLGDATSATA